MIGKNVGTVERVFRLLAGILLALWSVTRPEMNGQAWFAALLALFLVLNGVFGRCYLWHVLNLSSCGCNSIPADRFCDKTPA